MDRLRAMGKGWSEPTRRLWALLAQRDVFLSARDAKERLEAAMQAAGDGADLGARNAIGYSLLQMAFNSMSSANIDRLIQAAAPMALGDRERALEFAGNFLDSGSSKRMLDASFAKREARRIEEEALEAAAGQARSSAKTPRI